MKKFSLLLAFALTVGASALSPTIVNAQENPQAVFERDWYDTCYTKKDNERCCVLSKELLEKYPSSQYAKNAQKNVTACDIGKASEKFQNALKAYYAGPDANKLEQLFAAGDEFLKVQPNQQYVIGQMALASFNPVMSQTYKNMDRVKGYAERALKAFEPTTPPEGWQAADWNNLRELVNAQMNQLLGYHLTETKGDSEQAIAYLTKATQVRGKDGLGWKDPNNYWLRAQVHSRKYDELSAKYKALTDEQKTGEEGKALLKQIYEVLDTKMIPDYARTVTAATKPEAKELRDIAKKLFEDFWKYRTDAPDKAAEYLKKFEADPTSEAPPVPAKAESTDPGAMAAPTAGGNVKLSTGGTPTMAPGSNGSKAAPAKGKAAPAKKGRKGRRG